MPYIATFDAGTTAVKGVLVDMEGRVAVSQTIDIPTLFEKNYKEQDPHSWWAAFCAISKEFTQQVDPAAILGIVMSGQMQDLIPLDGDLAPVCNAILYSDGRGEQQARQLIESVGEQRFLEITGNHCDGSLPLPKLMWLKQERPDLYKKTRHILISSKDYIITRLTGCCCGDVTACATAGAMDIRRKRWDEELLKAADVPAELFPTLYAPHQQAGAVLEHVSPTCGYRPGTPVYAGVGDAGATTLASGIARPGQYHINLGTSGWVSGVSDDVLTSHPGVFNLAAPAENSYINVVPFLNGGNVHRWIGSVVAGRQRDGTTEVDHAALTALLEGSVAGSNGVLFLPYLSGERFPVLDPEARGSFVGLTTRTSQADLARACLEGVAFSLRQGMEQLGHTTEAISIIGGGGQEAVWCQILADVLDREMVVFGQSELLGSAAVAAIALLAMGKISSYEQFTAGLHTGENRVSYKPNANNRPLYDRQYARYLKLYPALKETL